MNLSSRFHDCRGISWWPQVFSLISAIGLVAVFVIWISKSSFRSVQCTSVLFESPLASFIRNRVTFISFDKYFWANIFLNSIIRLFWSTESIMSLVRLVRCHHFWLRRLMRPVRYMCGCHLPVVSKNLNIYFKLLSWSTAQMSNFCSKAYVMLSVPENSKCYVVYSARAFPYLPIDNMLFHFAVYGCLCCQHFVTLEVTYRRLYGSWSFPRFLAHHIHNL